MSSFKQMFSSRHPQSVDDHTAKIESFCSITSSTNAVAKKFLSKHSWEVEAAVNSYYSSNPSGSTVSTRKLQTLFDRYKDPDSDLIGVEGTEQLCKDLGVDPSDVVMLAIAFRLQSPHMCEFTRDGWVSGWTRLKCDGIEQMCAIVPQLRDSMRSDDAFFHQVYEYTFFFSREEGQRSLPLDTAVALWDLLLRSRFKLLDEWLQFIQETQSLAVPKDTWNMLLDFTKLASLEDYDPFGAWPSLIDDFVEHCKGHKQ